MKFQKLITAVTAALLLASQAAVADPETTVSDDGGHSGGGANTGVYKPHLVNADTLYYALMDAKQGVSQTLRWVEQTGIKKLNQGDETGEASVPAVIEDNEISLAEGLFQKVLKGNKTIFTVIKEAKIVVNKDGPCLVTKKDGTVMEKDGGASMVDDVPTICLSHANLKAKLTKENYFREVKGILAHEAAHFIVGFDNEVEPELLQRVVTAATIQLEKDKISLANTASNNLELTIQNLDNLRTADDSLLCGYIGTGKPGTMSITRTILDFSLFIGQTFDKEHQAFLAHPQYQDALFDLGMVLENSCDGSASPGYDSPFAKTMRSRLDSMGMEPPQQPKSGDMDILRANAAVALQVACRVYNDRFDDMPARSYYSNDVWKSADTAAICK